MVILSVGLTTLSATAARIHGMRLRGTTVDPAAPGCSVASASALAVAAAAAGSRSCQRSSAATTADNEPSANIGSSCGKPNALLGAAAAAAAAASNGAARA